MTLSDGSRHEVEYCNGVKSAKKAPRSISSVLWFYDLSLCISAFRYSILF
jgi:hypothetical protein